MNRPYVRTKVSAREKARLERVTVIEALKAEGKSQSEIARIMGISRQAVNQLINRHKVSSRKKSRDYVRKGLIIKARVCQECYAAPPTSLHHHDYTKPEDVVWVCEPCHVSLDNKGHSTRIIT